MKKIITLGLALSVIPTVAQAQCDNLKTPNDLLKCVVQSHATVKVGKSLIEEARLGIQVAEQQPNPELEAEVANTIGSGFGTDLTFMHTFERGGKKEARRRLASSEHALSKIALLNQQDQIILNTVLSLYRVRQIDHELEINKEIIKTFKNIITRYRKAGRLAPEQQVSISVFNLALEENRLNRTSLLSERKGFATQIQTNLGKEIEISGNLLPKVVRTWRALNTSSELEGNQVRLAKENVALSKARVLLEEAEAAPDISLGPKVGFEHDGSSSFSVGIALSMPIPLYHRNNGSRARARAEVNTKIARLDSLKEQVVKRKEYLEGVYKEVQRTIARTLTNKEVEIDHKNLHKMIKNGVVSASIIIELHRQILEFYDKLHQQELKGIKALWQLHAINGTIQSEELK